MEYKGRLYGKVGSSYFILEETTEDVERLKAKNKMLELKLQITEKALNDILKTEDDGSVDGNWQYPETIAEIAIDKIANI